MENTRAWVAKIQYHDKEPLWIGTVYCRLRATHQEVEEAVTKEVLKVLPEGFKICELSPGMVILHLDDS